MLKRMSETESEVCFGTSIVVIQKQIQHTISASVSYNIFHIGIAINPLVTSLHEYNIIMMKTYIADIQFIFENI
jgi:hypothetical protein